MCISKLSVGLDYHQDQVQVCVLDEQGKVLMNRSLSNHAQAIHGAVAQYGEVTAVAIEACCGAANLADELNALGWNVSLAHPGFVSRMKQNPVIKKLMQFAGVGLVTAVTMRAEIGQFDRFQNGKQLSRFCGVTPRNASSGNRQADAGLIRAGNPQLRRVLIELSHRLINSAEPRWSKLAANLLKEGKKKNVVVAAIANRWVRWLHHQMLSAQLAA